MNILSLVPELTSIPSSWKTVPFDEAFEDVTGGNVKIKQSDYLPSGCMPVIDQGQNFIAGYVDDHSLSCKVNLPVILFGDHTKTFKFVTDPFALGADGVKVLEPCQMLDPKFGYYYLQLVRFPADTGYSRHFKYLKAIKVPLPPLDEQRRIAAILDKADAIRRKRQESIRLTEELLRSTFLDMFGDPVTNPKGWEMADIDSISQIQGGLQVTTKRFGNPLEIPYLRVANVYRDRLDLSEIKTMPVTHAELERIKLERGDILIVEGHGNPEEIGRSSVWDASITPCIHQNHLIRVRINLSIADPVFISAYLNSPGGRKQLFNFGKTTSGLNTISTSNVKNTKVLLPPISEQKRFHQLVTSTKKIQNKANDNLDINQQLSNSLTHRAFRGEL